MNRNLCYRSLEKCLRMLMLNIDDLNKTIIAYNKYVADKQRHDVTVYNAIQKRVRLLHIIQPGHFLYERSSIFVPFLRRIVAVEIKFLLSASRKRAERSERRTATIDG